MHLPRIVLVGFLLSVGLTIACIDEVSGPALDNSDARAQNDGSVDLFGLPDMGSELDSDSSADGRADTPTDAVDEVEICFGSCDCCGSIAQVAYPCGTDPNDVCAECICPDVGEDVPDEECVEHVCFDCLCECPNGQIHEVPDGACFTYCDTVPDPDPICDVTCDMLCAGGDCLLAEFHTIEQIEERYDELDGVAVWLEGLMSWGSAVCTLEECPEDDPCCNDCSASLGFRIESTFFLLVTPPEVSAMLGCWGNECNLFNGCYPAHPGENVRLRVEVSRDEAGNPQLVLQEFCEGAGRAPRRADAYLSWQSPGGFAGWGPAMVITGDGTIKAWENEYGFDPASPPDDPTYETNISTNSTDELFERWANADVSDLPHSHPWAECYPMVYVRLCDECQPIEIAYNVADQLEPEMEAVWDWFDAVIGSGEDRENPRNYCRFE